MYVYLLCSCVCVCVFPCTRSAGLWAVAEAEQLQWILCVCEVKMKSLDTGLVVKACVSQTSRQTPNAGSDLFPPLLFFLWISQTRMNYLAHERWFQMNYWCFILLCHMCFSETNIWTDLNVKLLFTNTQAGVERVSRSVFQEYSPTLSHHLNCPVCY